jgi:hypothetical protein
MNKPPDQHAILVFPAHPLLRRLRYVSRLVNRFIMYDEAGQPPILLQHIFFQPLYDESLSSMIARYRPGHT